MITPRRSLRCGAVVAAAFACSPVLAGCGGGDADAGPPANGPTPTHADPQPTRSRLSVAVEPPQAAPGDTVAASVVNKSQKPFTYGRAYALERQAASGFEEAELPDRPVPQIGLVAPPGGTGPPVRVQIPDDAQPGTWRVVLARGVPGVGRVSGEFEVTGG